MRNLRWQLLIAFGGLVIVVGLLLGQTPSTSTTGPEPVSGGVYTEALVGQFMRLNPILDLYNQPDQDVDRLIYSGLLRFDSRGVPVPMLAEQWAISADASLYSFTLREDARWHDGSRVTSDDVIYTFSKFQDEDYPGPDDLHDLWQEINIIRLDDRRVQFQLPESYAPFLDYLAVGLLPDHLLRGVSAGELIDHPFNLEPVGTGPFRFDRFLTEDGEIFGVSLEAFEDYVDGPPFLERVEFLLYPDPQSAFQAYLDEEVMGIGEITDEILTSSLETVGINMHSARIPELGVIFLNLQHPEKEFLAEKRVRQALLLAINRGWIIQRVFNGQGMIAHGPIMPGTWAYADQMNTYPFDPDRAAMILEELGWELTPGAALGSPEYVRTKDEVRLSIELIHPNTAEYTQIAEIIQGYWQAIGVEVDLVPTDAQAIREDYLEPRDYEAALTEISLANYPDPDPYPFWHDSQSETGQNYSGWSDRNSSIWMEQARINPDLTRRAELYASFQYRFQDQLPALMLYYRVHNYGIDNLVQGVTVGPLLSPSDRFNTIDDWYLIARRAQPGE